MINKINLNNVNSCLQVSLNRTNFVSQNNKTDSLSFKGGLSGIIVSSNPFHAKQLMLIPINNYGANAKGFFHKAMTKVFKCLFALSQPNEILKDAGTRTFLDVKNDKITGGIIGINLPAKDYFKCLSMAFDTTNQSRKESVKSLYSLAEAMCNYCEKENIHNISWMANPNNKSMINLYGKFAVYRNRVNNSYNYTVSVDRLKEFLSDTRKKHPKIFK